MDKVATPDLEAGGEDRMLLENPVMEEAGEALEEVGTVSNADYSIFDN